MINSNTSKIDSNISSAEMTAYWRSQYPSLSDDKFSVNLASKEGISKAHEFEKKFNYPLVGRKVSVRAGFFLKQAVDLLLTGKFDACISFASGFSLLGYYITAEIQNKFPEITVIESDLSHIIHARNTRLESIRGQLNHDVLSKLKATALDLEQACRDGKSLRELFPTYHSPVFVIEGVIYFLSKSCVDWLINEISQYPTVAIIVDYWPEEGVLQSECFNKVVQSLKGFIPENIKSFWDSATLKDIHQKFDVVQDCSIQHVENQYSILHNEEPQFIDQNKFFPVHLLVAQNKTQKEV